MLDTPVIEEKVDQRLSETEQWVHKSKAFVSGCNKETLAAELEWVL